MSDENVKVLFKVTPKNDESELKQMLEEFEATDEKLTGIVTIPKTNQLVTEEGHLLMVHPHRLDFAQACEPDEFVALAEQ
ncbi:hypothetical protein HYP07_gp098 [Vibrio phage JSF3]|uniref:Uncharacterized protein n=1 Tax=Vibrio phage phi 1 TaxID=1589297 RepID=A0A0B5H2J5_9CAUD|nr:hypothetical protein AVV30_gp014 [Vibrio phage phi 1]YP_009876323.1 hypothetical protein HYP07_gp098 [Vibrio phage JSF3]AJF40672.1 hypothetical protein SBVP1_0014 [Vibrio phage phi 1]APD18110.1 hypothetical protein [Vibrio phage JSF3]UYF10841.1 hypothetical protein 12VC501_gene0043 [Vibrio phage 12VC501]